MSVSLKYRYFVAVAAIMVLGTASVLADELTWMIQEDLTALGYETGGTSGELSVQTAVAISKFEAEHNLNVTGEPSPQLAGIVRAKRNGKYQPSATVDAAPAIRDSQNLRDA